MRPDGLGGDVDGEAAGEWMRVLNELRLTLPLFPDPDSGAFTRPDGARDEAAYREAVEVWRRDCARVIQGARAAGAGSHDPASLDGWAPQGSVAVAEALRTVLAHDAKLARGRVLSPGLAKAVAEVVQAQDRLVSVWDPDDPFAMPLWEGRGSLAWRGLAPGVYDATGFDGRGEYKVVVAPPLQWQDPPVSAAFPAWAANAATLESIATIVTSVQGDARRTLNEVHQVLVEAGWLAENQLGKPTTMGKRHDMLAERAAQIRQAQIDDEPVNGRATGHGDLGL